MHNIQYRDSKALLPIECCILFSPLGQSTLHNVPLSPTFPPPSHHLPNLVHTCCDDTNNNNASAFSFFFLNCYLEHWLLFKHDNHLIEWWCEQWECEQWLCQSHWFFLLFFFLNTDFFKNLLAICDHSYQISVISTSISCTSHPSTPTSTPI